jgi:hypothetical protein
MVPVAATVGNPYHGNFACWLWMHGHRDKAVAIAGLSDDLRARLLAQT